MTAPDVATEAAYGVTSMTAPLRRVLVRRPATTGDWAGAAWRTPDAGLLAFGGRPREGAGCERRLWDLRSSG